MSYSSGLKTPSGSTNSSETFILYQNKPLEQVFIKRSRWEQLRKALEVICTYVQDPPKKKIWKDAEQCKAACPYTVLSTDAHPRMVPSTNASLHDDMVQVPMLRFQVPTHPRYKNRYRSVRQLVSQSDPNYRIRVISLAIALFYTLYSYSHLSILDKESSLIIGAPPFH
jgi:hypothetical protein